MQTRPAFQRFEAVAVLLLERFRGGFAFSAGPGPGLSRESADSQIRNRPCVNSRKGRAHAMDAGRRFETQPAPLFAALEGREFALVQVRGA
jgi:hypothetical protein